jgi:molybdopterin converting factor small subunit
MSKIEASMKNILTIASLLACTVWWGAARAQDASTPLPQPERPAQAAPPAGAPDMQTDRFTASREAADMRQAAYLDLDKRNMAEIDRLMLTKKCQVNRIVPLLKDTVSAMNDWLAAEKKYWDLWNDAEGRRVEDLQTTLAGLEADAARIAKLVETETEGLQELLKQKAILEADTRTAEVVAKIDGVIKDIRDSQARLDHANQEQDSVSARIRDLKASIATRLVRIRENISKLGAWEVDQNAYYAERLTSANDVCQAPHPTGNVPPAKKKDQ